MTLAIPIPVADRSWSYRGVAGCTAGILFMEEWGQLPNRSTVDVVIAFGAVEERKEIHDEKKKFLERVVMEYEVTALMSQFKVPRDS